MVPVDVSLNDMVRGTVPVSGVALKFEVGAVYGIALLASLEKPLSPAELMAVAAK
jgi:hypothetical protein